MVYVGVGKSVKGAKIFKFTLLRNLYKTLEPYFKNVEGYYSYIYNKNLCGISECQPG